MLAALCMVLASSASAADTAARSGHAASGKPQILVVDLRGDGVEAPLLRLARDAVITSLSHHSDIEVVSSDDIRQLVSLDAERRALGCDEASCLAEVGSALGVRYIIYGSVVTTGELHVITINLFDTNTSKAIAREMREMSSVDDLPAKAREAATALVASAGVSTTAGDPPSASPLAIAGGVGAGVGLVLVVVAAVGVGVAGQTFYDNTLPPRGPSSKDKESARGLGQLSTIGVVTGVVVAGAGATTLVLGWE